MFESYLRLDELGQSNFSDCLSFLVPACSDIPNVQALPSTRVLVNITDAFLASFFGPHVDLHVRIISGDHTTDDFRVNLHECFGSKSAFRGGGWWGHPVILEPTNDKAKRLYGLLHDAIGERAVEPKRNSAAAVRDDQRPQAWNTCLRPKCRHGEEDVGLHHGSLPCHGREAVAQGAREYGLRWLKDFLERLSVVGM